MKQSRLYWTSLSGIFLALLIISAQLTIPLPFIPLTLQTLVLGLIASILPLSYSLKTIGSYLLLGALGLPVFANAKGGLGVFVSVTGGYLVGFLVYVLVVAVLLKRNRSLLNLSFSNLLGAFLQLVCGSLGMMFVSQITFKQAFLLGTVPFILPGIVKIVLVVLLVKAFDSYSSKVSRQNS